MPCQRQIAAEVRRQKEKPTGGMEWRDHLVQLAVRLAERAHELHASALRAMLACNTGSGQDRVLSSLDAPHGRHEQSHRMLSVADKRQDSSAHKSSQDSTTATRNARSATALCVAVILNRPARRRSGRAAAEPSRCPTRDPAPHHPHPSPSLQRLHPPPPRDVASRRLVRQTSRGLSCLRSLCASPHPHTSERNPTNESNQRTCLEAEPDTARSTKDARTSGTNGTEIVAIRICFRHAPAAIASARCRRNSLASPSP